MTQSVSYQELHPSTLPRLIAGKCTLANWDWMAGISLVSSVFALCSLCCITKMENLEAARVQEEKANRKCASVARVLIIFAMAASAYSFATTYRLGYSKIN